VQPWWGEWYPPDGWMMGEDGRMTYNRDDVGSFECDDAEFRPIFSDLLCVSFDGASGDTNQLPNILQNKIRVLENHARVDKLFSERDCSFLFVEVFLQVQRSEEQSWRII
jgi:hypothetical protein